MAYGDVSWRELFEETRESIKDDSEIVCNLLSDEEMDKKFDSSYGWTNGEFFTIWTEKNVYFPVCYDGSEWVGWAPRNPCDTKMGHQGGG